MKVKMNTGLLHRAWGVLFAVAVAMVGSASIGGCAQEGGDINRVQPDYTRKDWLQGEWYFRVTVAAAPALSANTFPGNQSMMERGVFEIQQDMVHFYRTYEWANRSEIIGQSADIDTPLVDGDGKVVTREVEVNGVKVQSPVYIFRGAPLASWPIMRHFDMKRTYNSLTGEETNVTAENTDDRKWYQREYMHVDWANAQYHSLDFPVSSSAQSTGDRVNFTAVAPKSGGGANEQSEFDFDNYGDSTERLKYFDISVRGIFEIPSMFLEGFGEVPLCWFFPWFAGGVFECQSEEVQLRFAFKRYEGSDFQAWNYDDEKLSRFGFYRADRLEWDQWRGLTYSGVNRHAIRFRIWDRYVRTASGDLDYGQMNAQPIVYYQTESTPRDLVVPNISLMAEWSVPFDETVGKLKGAKPSHSMVILCENNLQEACQAYAKGLPTATFSAPGQEAEACSRVGISVQPSSGASPLASANAAFCNVDERPKRLGDLRYNLLGAMPQQIQFGLYGFGPPSFDPLTGEIVNANAYSYAAPMLRGANTALTTIEMMAGVRSFLEIESGDYIRDAMEAKRLRAGGSISSVAYDLSSFGQGGMDNSVWTALSTTGLPADTNTAQTQLGRIKARPDLEQLMVAPGFRALVKDPNFVGKDPDAQLDLTPAALEMASPRNWATASAMQKRELEEHNHAMHGCEYMENFVDSAILGLVREYGERYNREFCTEFEGQFPEIFNWQAFRNVGSPCKLEGAQNNEGMVCRRVTQEVGGEPQLRWVNVCTVKKMLQQMTEAVIRIEGYDPFDLYPPGSPAYEPSKRQELTAAVNAFRSKLNDMRQTCVVELWQQIYRGVQLHEVGHNLGLRHNFEGSTDALNFGPEYWNIKMEPDDEGVLRATNLWQPDTQSQSYQKMREFESSSVMEYTRKFNGRFLGLGLYDHAAIHYGYGGLVEVFNSPPDLDALKKFAAEPPSASAGNQKVLGPGVSELDEAFRRVHHTNYPKYFGNTISRMYDRKWVRERDLSSNDVVVPYRFCSDEYAGATPTCQRHDEGVDPFEVAQRHAENYEAYWPLEGYAHDSVAFSAGRYASGVQRYFYEMRKQFQHWVQLKMYYDQNDWWAKNIGNGKAWDDDINGGLTYKEAAKLSFNVMANAFGRPAEGRYGRNSRTGRYEPVYWLSQFPYTQQVNITQEDGARPFYESFDFSGYIYRPFRSGAIYDRIFAFSALTDPTAFNFLNTEEEADATRFRVNYYTVWPDKLTRLVGGLMVSDERQYGWWACMNNPNSPPERLQPRDFFSKVAPAGCHFNINPEPTSAFPNAKYRLPALAALHGMALMTRNYDKSFMDASRLCLEGSGDCVEFAPGTDVARFADPLSGKVYMAARHGDINDYDPAYELVNRASQEFSAFVNSEGEIQLDLLQNQYYFSELQFLTGRLELVRGMHLVYSGGK